MRAKILNSLCRVIVKWIIADTFYRAFIRPSVRKALDIAKDS